MFGLLDRASFPPRDYSACSGCGLCRLVCPTWRRRRDPRFTAEGLARALQCGATAAELAPSLEACSLCGACDPVCPECIDLTGMIIELRRKLSQRHREAEEAANSGAHLPPPLLPNVSSTGSLLLPGAELRADPAQLGRVRTLLDFACAGDDGADIALALETGGDVAPARQRSFLSSLDRHTLVVGDGLLLRLLRLWRPKLRVRSLGEALSNKAALRRRIASTDFYVIEARAFHADYERLVKHYDRLRAETGCAMNLDLQRIAIPAAGDDSQVRWILQGRKATRIVVENLADRAAFERACDIPVVHIADLAED